jgi:lysophospholipid acyltransferase (LPLAT)-like uncharacterized protein
VRITPRRARYLGTAAALLLRGLGRSWRVRISTGTYAPRADAIYLFHHGELLMPTCIYRDTGCVVLISRHGDGELIAQTVERLGQHAVRGSSTRGASQATLELLRHWSHRPWIVTPDGPRGPRGKVEAGVVLLAARSGRPLVPLGFAATPAKRLGSWDRFRIPAPFARVHNVIGDDIVVPSDVSADGARTIAALAAARLWDCQRAAQRLVGEALDPDPVTAGTPEDGR